MQRGLMGLSLAGLLMASPGPAFGQGISDRIDEVRRQRMAEQQQQRAQQDAATNTTNAAAQPRRTMAERMRVVIPDVELEGMPARQAFQWWARRTGAGLVINWRQMQRAGVNPDTPINLDLKSAPATPVLRMIMQQAGQGRVQLVYETTPWYVRVMSKQAANRRTVLRLYDVRDLMMTVPNFSNAPNFDLRNALRGNQGGNRGGGGSNFGGGNQGGGLFGDEQDNDEEEPGQSEQARANDLIQVVTTTVEPTVWRRNGGQHASISYFRGMLVVNAPVYVHRQIGIPVQRTQPYDQ